MRSYLHRLDIDGAMIFARHGVLPALTTYYNAVYYNAVISISSGRHGAATLARQGVVRALHMVVLNND